MSLSPHKKLSGHFTAMFHTSERSEYVLDQCGRGGEQSQKPRDLNQRIAILRGSYLTGPIHKTEHEDLGNTLTQHWTHRSVGCTMWIKGA